MSAASDRPGPGLTGTQRKALRGLAHSLAPVVQVGRLGVNDSVLAAVDRALHDHELIKVKIAGARDVRGRLAVEIEQGCQAHLAGTIGTIAILYRPHPDEAQRRIVLPKAPASAAADGPSPGGDDPATDASGD